MHTFSYRSVHRHLPGDQLMVRLNTCRMVFQRQLDELLTLTEPCSIRGGLEYLYWTNYSLHLLNSSHKFSYGGEYILFIEKKNCLHRLNRQGVVKLPSEARLDIF